MQLDLFSPIHREEQFDITYSEQNLFFIQEGVCRHFCLSLNFNNFGSIDPNFMQIDLFSPVHQKAQLDIIYN